MSENIILTFALLFSSAITLICAVYIALTQRRLINQNGGK